MIPQPGPAALPFGCIAIGGVACVAAGVAADRFGRTAIAMLSLFVSGSCCLVVGQLYGGPPWMLLAVCVLWGFAIIADSAQYSASVSELAEPEYVGTALTLQTCLGFLLTLGSIRLIPILVDWVTWDLGVRLSRAGPALGLLSMHRLQTDTRGFQDRRGASMRAPCESPTSSAMLPQGIECRSATRRPVSTQRDLRKLPSLTEVSDGRGGRIRTADPLLPKQVR